MKRIFGCLILILLASTATIFAQDFGYTGGVQTFTASVDGWYKLEVWGGQGQAFDNAGGKGGYAVGYKYLTSGTNLYVVVGGGTGNTYNGGGGTWDEFVYCGRNCGLVYDHKLGGGATHIATTNRGVLSNYNSYRGEVLIVAGGGGGDGNNIGYAGSGGGTEGEDSRRGVEYTTEPSVRGTQSGGNAFGQGSNSGGGGWYGGKNNAGGSGYTGGVTSYNGSSPSMSNGVREGNGYAKITLVYDDTKYYVDLNAVVNGTQYYSLNNAATANVYINGSLVSSNVDDFCTAYSNGTKFKMVITLKSGYGILSGSTTCEGTVNGGGTGCNFNLASKYTITVNPNNGTSTISETRLWSQIYTLPSAPTKKGFTFVSWKRTS